MRDKQTCGCVHDGHAWIKLCAPCEASYQEVHKRWADEHVLAGKAGIEPATEALTALRSTD